jgi:hypothetical protein
MRVSGAWAISRFSEGDKVVTFRSIKKKKTGSFLPVRRVSFAFADCSASALSIARFTAGQIFVVPWALLKGSE